MDSPIASSREDRKRQTRRRLLDAAAELFAELGSEETSTRLVARRAGVSVGAIYVHFKDKEALLQAVLAEPVERLFQSLDELLRAHERGEKIDRRAVAELVVGLAEADPIRARLLFSPQTLSGPVGRRLVEGIIDRQQHTLDHFYRTTPSLKTPAGFHPASLAVGLTGAVTAVITWWTENPGRAGREEIIETITLLRSAVL